MGVKENDAVAFPEELIDELLKDEGEIISYTKKTTSFNELNGVKNPETISPLTVSQNDLTIYNVVQRINERPGYDNFKFTSNAYWNNDPFWKLLDCFGSCWNGGFTIYSDSCTYSAHENSTANLRSFACPRNAATPSVGVTHNVDLLAGYWGHSARQTVKVYKTNTTGTANLVTEYGHEQYGLSSISCSISTSGIGMGVGIGSSIDKGVPALSSFTY